MMKGWVMRYCFYFCIICIIVNSLFLYIDSFSYLGLSDLLMKVMGCFNCISIVLILNCEVFVFIINWFVKFEIVRIGVFFKVCLRCLKVVMVLDD